MDRAPAFVCIEARDPVESGLAALQERFGLHDLAVKDSMRPAQAQRSKEWVTAGLLN